MNVPRIRIICFLTSAENAQNKKDRKHEMDFSLCFTLKRLNPWTAAKARIWDGSHTNEQNTFSKIPSNIWKTVSKNRPLVMYTLYPCGLVYRFCTSLVSTSLYSPCIENEGQTLQETIYPSRTEGSEKWAGSLRFHVKIRLLWIKKWTNKAAEDVWQWRPLLDLRECRDKPLYLLFKIVFVL